jgi:hypothetical protein
MGHLLVIFNSLGLMTRTEGISVRAMTRTEGISVRAIRVPPQLFGFVPVERACVKLNV